MKSLIMLFAIMAAPLSAQALQCRVPSVVPEASAERAPRSERRAVQPATIGYTLALSWSPEYCRTRGREPGSALQCSGAIGRFGFILHGLWAEGGREDPRWCRPVAPPPPSVVRAQLCVMPSARLIGHEWAKHGSCITRTPAAYFEAARRLWDAIRFPDMDRLSRANGGAGPSAGELRAAFVAENAGLTPAMIAVDANARGWLREVRLCLDLRFNPRACPASDRGLGDAKPVRIWRGGAAASR